MVLLQAASASAVLEAPSELSSLPSGSPARADMIFCQTKASARRVILSYGPLRQRLTDGIAAGCSTGLEDERCRPVTSASGSGPQNVSQIESCTIIKSACGAVSRCVAPVGVRSLMDGCKLNGGRSNADDSSRFVLSGEALATAGEDMDSGPRGAIHIILGPMFAGKTTALLRQVQVEIDSGRKVVLVKSDKDARYAVSAVVSHDGAQLPCYAVTDLETFRLRLGEEYSKVDVIGIDEAQFFPDLVPFCQAAADAGKTIIVAGLDGDFLRQPFGMVLNLVTLADTVTKLAARCELCGQPASFSFRKSGDTEKIYIGGADVYMPVCRRHYASGQAALQTARSVLDQAGEKEQGDMRTDRANDCEDQPDARVAEVYRAHCPS